QIGVDPDSSAAGGSAVVAPSPTEQGQSALAKNSLRLAILRIVGARGGATLVRVAVLDRLVSVAAASCREGEQCDGRDKLGGISTHAVFFRSSTASAPEPRSRQRGERSRA